MNTRSDRLAILHKNKIININKKYSILLIFRNKIFKFRLYNNKKLQNKYIKIHLINNMNHYNN
jgi:hypothetical protein